MYYIVIPAYQPDQKLLTLLEEIQQQLTAQVIVVNDGSSPKTQAIFAQVKKRAILLEHPTNMGKGQALRTAFSYIQSLGRAGIVVTADADGQHTTRDIDRVAHAASHLPDRLILGSRQFTDSVPWRSRFGNKLTRLLFALETQVQIGDTQTGLRAFDSRFLPFLLAIEGDRYEYEMNMLLQVSQHYTITEIPIETIYINDNESSHFRPIRDGLMIYKHLLQFALASFGGFVIDYAVYAISLLLLAFLPTASRLFLANTLARLTSSVCNYQMNKSLVFKKQDTSKTTGLAYFTLVLALFLCDTALLYLLHSLLGFNLYLMKILVGILLFFVSWLVQKYFIFNERRPYSHDFS